MFVTLNELGVGKKISFTVPRWVARAALPFIRSNLFSKYSLYVLGINPRFNNEKSKVDLDFNPRELRESMLDMLKEMGHGE
jgi:hypothetical protein